MNKFHKIFASIFSIAVLSNSLVNCMESKDKNKELSDFFLEKTCSAGNFDDWNSKYFRILKMSDLEQIGKDLCEHADYLRKINNKEFDEKQKIIISENSLKEKFKNAKTENKLVNMFTDLYSSVMNDCGNDTCIFRAGILCKYLQEKYGALCTFLQTKGHVATLVLVEDDETKKCIPMTIEIFSKKEKTDEHFYIIRTYKKFTSSMPIKSLGRQTVGTVYIHPFGSSKVGSGVNLWLREIVRRGIGAWIKEGDKEAKKRALDLIDYLSDLEDSKVFESWPVVWLDRGKKTGTSSVAFLPSIKKIKEKLLKDNIEDYIKCELTYNMFESLRDFAHYDWEKQKSILLDVSKHLNEPIIKCYLSTGAGNEEDNKNFSILNINPEYRKVKYEKVGDIFKISSKFTYNTFRNDIMKNKPNEKLINNVTISPNFGVDYSGYKPTKSNATDYDGIRYVSKKFYDKITTSNK